MRFSHNHICQGHKIALFWENYPKHKQILQDLPEITYENPEIA
jgi:hypothetical protein